MPTPPPQTQHQILTAMQTEMEKCLNFYGDEIMSLETELAAIKTEKMKETEASAVKVKQDDEVGQQVNKFQQDRNLKQLRITGIPFTTAENLTLLMEKLAEPPPYSFD